jgi:hypothetical protein
MGEQLDRSSCIEARQYYYDYIGPSARQQIPGPILAHINACAYCLAQIARLQAELSEADDRMLAQKDEVIAGILEDHFSYLDGPVDCAAARPFLPQLANGTVTVRIPTPITLHVDQCQQCGQDLELIRSWSLRRPQINRLSVLFAGRSLAGWACEQTDGLLHDLVRFEYDQADPHILAHAFACRTCRDRVYLARAMFLEHLEARSGQGGHRSICQRITDADLFDLVLPVGIGTGLVDEARTLTAVREHVRPCTRCLARVQAMHKELSRIASRGNSGIVTSYSLGPGGKDPVRSRQPRRRLALRAAAGIAALACLLGLWALVPRAGADTLSRLLKAFSTVTYLHVTTQNPEGQVQEFWLDRSAKRCLLQGASKVTLWDLRAGVRKDRTLPDGSVEVRNLDQAEMAWVNAALEGGFGLVPFTDRESVPGSARCESITTSRPDSGDIYELIWPAQYGTGRRRWRVQLDPDTGLPRQAHYYLDDGSGIWRLEAVLTADYPSGVEQILEGLAPDKASSGH